MTALANLDLITPTLTDLIIKGLVTLGTKEIEKTSHNFTLIG